MRKIPKELPPGTRVCIPQGDCFIFEDEHFARHHGGVMLLEDWLLLAVRDELTDTDGSLWFATVNYYHAKRPVPQELRIKGRRCIPYWATHVQWYPNPGSVGHVEHS